MKKKLLYGFILSSMVLIGKSQTNRFYPNDVSDAFSIFGDNSNNTTGTARYIGMGGSMGALGGDLSAVETNPAGLGIFRNSVANISMSILSNKNKATMGNGVNSNTDTNFNIPGAGVALALGDEADVFKVNVGVNFSYQRVDNDVNFSRNTKLNYLYPNKDNVDQLYEMVNYDQYTNGYKSKMKFSLATNYMDRLYFGIGLDWHYLNIDRNSEYGHRNTVDGEYMKFNEQLTPYSQEANGFGLNVGVIGKITPEIRLGAAYHSPIWWSDMDDYRWIYGYDDKGQFVEDYVYYDHYKNVSPGKLVLSGAFASNIVDDDNSLAFNFDFINYFNKDMEFKGDVDYRLNNNFVNDYVRNSQEYRAGIEYRFRELKLRAGYAYASSPVKSNSISGIWDTNSDPVFVKNYLAGEKNKLSFGAGYDIGQFFVDLGYQYIKTDYRTTLSGDFYTVGGSNLAISLDKPYLGKVNNIQNNFVLTLGMRF